MDPVRRKLYRVLFIGVAAKEPIHINYSIYLGVCQGMFHVKHLGVDLVRYIILSKSCIYFVRSCVI